MIRKSSAASACVIACVCTFIVASVFTAGAGLAILSGAGLLKSAAERPLPTIGPGTTAGPGTSAQAGDYSRLDEIRGIYHNYALTDVSDQELLDGAAYGMAYGSGDMYSQFFTPEDFKEFQQQEQGNYVGIGVSVNVDPKDSLITAMIVYKGSPAEKAGMRPGDKILRVDGSDVTALNLDETVKLVRGEPGTQVRITVLRGDEQIELEMTRAAVKVEFTTGDIVEDGIGYIRILEFNGNAAGLFDKRISELKQKGAKGFIIDLRNNPGGGLDVVAPIADQLFPAGPIITMVDRNGTVKDKLSSKAGYLNMPLVVLINENSASASELLCGGIQDYGVGTLVGVTTYGKGVAQSFATLSDGSVLKYTADKYLTGGGPDGSKARCPQSVGIQPDIVVELDEAVKENPLLLCTHQDNQYMRALQELRRMVAGE